VNIQLLLYATGLGPLYFARCSAVVGRSRTCLLRRGVAVQLDSRDGGILALAYQSLFRLRCVNSDWIWRPQTVVNLLAEIAQGLLCDLSFRPMLVVLIDSASDRLFSTNSIKICRVVIP